MKQVLMDSLRTLLGLLPFVATVAWATVFRFQRRHDFREWRWSLALACMMLGTFVLAVTEVLSSAHCLNAGCAVLAWSVYLLIPLVILSKKHASIDIRSEVARVAVKLKQVPLWMLGLILLLCGVMVVMAVASPPMNFDVQCYHLPRQVYWLQQGSVLHFNATYPYQNLQPVLTEYLGLNLLLLSGGDAWHNLIQCLFFVAASGLVTLITQSIGGGGRAQALAVLFIALVPVVFFEASNSKNDIVLSFFLLVPLLIGLKILSLQWKAGVPLLLLASLAAGLAMATKGTSAAYLPAPAILILIACRRAGAWRSLLLAIAPGLIIALLPMAPNSIRNILSYHSLSGEAAALLNDTRDPRSVAGVVVKNLANQFAFGSRNSIKTLENATRGVLLKLGVNPDDPHTNGCFEQLKGPNLQFLYLDGCEDVIPAPVQTALVLLIPIFFLLPSFKKDSGTIPLACVLFGSFLVFCAIFRWQPWGGRLLIPEFFLAAPLIGLAEALLLPIWGLLLLTALELFFLQPHMLSNGTRHLEGGRSVFALSKESQMSVALPGRQEEIRSLMDVLHASGKGVYVVKVDGKYSPIYGLLRQMRLEFPMIKIRSGHAGLSSGEDAVLEAVGSSSDKSFGPQGYRTLWSGRFYRLYLRNP